LTITDKSDHRNTSCTLTFISVCTISDIHIHTARQMYACFNKNVDIQYSAHDVCLKWPSQGIFIVERLESENSLEARKSKDIHKIAKIG
jgi:hypothetical protein